MNSSIEKIPMVKKKTNKLSLGDSLVLFFCFLGALNFINRYYYCFFIAFVLLLVFKKIKVPENISTPALILFAVSILLFSNSKSVSVTTIMKPFIFLICYIIGYNLMESLRGEKQVAKNVYIIRIIITLSLGCFVHYLLNWFVNFDAVIRNTEDFWTNSELSATGQMSFACYIIALSFALIFSERKLWHKMIALSILLCVFGYNMILAGRTLLMMVLLMAIASFLFYFVYNHYLKNIRTVIIVFSIFAVMIMLYYSDFMNIKSMFESSNLYYRFFDINSIAEFDEDLRMFYKGRYLDNIFEAAFGGNKIHQIVGGYAHDLYLDTYDEIGVFGFASIVVLIVSSLKNMFRFSFNRKINFNTRQIVFCIYLVANIEFFIEPILVGIPWFLAMYFMIDGAVLNYIEHMENYEAVDMVCS